MDKVWFKLRQTHYPPGPESSVLSGTSACSDPPQAPICLGHCVRDLQRLDAPLDAGAVPPFPTRMKVFRAATLDFRWEDARAREARLTAAIGAPLAAALGLVTLKAALRLAFRWSVTEAERYQRLDTYFVQPSKGFVDECLKGDEVAALVKGKKTWKFFIVTGIRVARAGKRRVAERAEVRVGGGPAADVPTVAAAELTGDVGRENNRTVDEGEVSDFIWAVKLAKVHKGILMTDWSIDPYTHRATFSTGAGEEIDVAAVVHREGLRDFKVVNDDELREAIVVDAESWQEA